MARRSLADKLLSMCYISGGGAVFFGGLNFYRNDAKFYDELLMPITRTLLTPETAHNVSIFAAKYGLFPKSRYSDPVNLETKFLKFQLTNPIGLAAGLDKQGDAVAGLHNLGFSFVEIGSVTPLPQPGNPKPRVFRLPEDLAVINRFGFNSDGHEVVHNRIYSLKAEKGNFTGIIGVNLGKNKESENAIVDYVAGVKKFADVADYFVINISSPNTPGLRNLQQKEHLRELLSKVTSARDSTSKNIPIFLKLSPDLTESEAKDIANVISHKECKIDGLLISNTTVKRDGLQNVQLAKETGGLSGKPLTNKSTEMIRRFYKLTKAIGKVGPKMPILFYRMQFVASDVSAMLQPPMSRVDWTTTVATLLKYRVLQTSHGSLPIIGVGGIFSGADAYEKILAGASALQIYTAFVYHGPPIVNKIKSELSELLEKDGYKNITEAIGKGADAYEKILAGASALQIYTAFVYHGPPIVNKIKSELSELLEKDGYKNITEAIGKGVQ